MALWVWLVLGVIVVAAFVSSVRAWRRFERDKPGIFSADEQRRDDPPDIDRLAG
ncbi:MAG: hypothetical protein JWN61_2580 [Pseudonocardiales bacterium]|nr:hypothetical protein [Pseudonocardiales bacterium]